MLGAYLAIKHFKHALQGTDFTLNTDHQPIAKAKCVSNLDRHSPTEARHLSCILEFTSDVHYIVGRENVVADALSRMNVITDQAVTFDDLAKPQLVDVELQNLNQTQSGAITHRRNAFPKVRVQK